MQYLLTQEEYDALRAKQELDLGMKKDKLQKLCTTIADTMPVKQGWRKDEEAKPWGCILSVEEDHYCDKCPVQDICPNEYKDWSK